jgi:hypothetical protein
MYIWTILAIVALILLIKYWNSSGNAAWGGLALGIIVGVLWKFIGGTDWYIIAKVATITTLVGAGSEMFSTKK